MIKVTLTDEEAAIIRELIRHEITNLHGMAKVADEWLHDHERVERYVEKGNVMDTILDKLEKED